MSVTGILVPKILVRGPKFSAIFPENLGPGPFFSNIVLNILVLDCMFRWTKIFSVISENFGPGPFYSVIMLKFWSTITKTRVI